MSRTWSRPSNMIARMILKCSGLRGTEAAGSKFYWYWYWYSETTKLNLLSFKLEGFKFGSRWPTQLSKIGQPWIDTTHDSHWAPCCCYIGADDTEIGQARSSARSLWWPLRSSWAEQDRLRVTLWSAWVARIWFDLASYVTKAAWMGSLSSGRRVSHDVRQWEKYRRQFDIASMIGSRERERESGLWSHLFEVSRLRGIESNLFRVSLALTISLSLSHTLTRRQIDLYRWLIVTL